MIEKAVKMRNTIMKFAARLAAVAIVAAGISGASQADAAVTISGATFAGYLLTTSPIKLSNSSTMRMLLTGLTSGATLEVCAGTQAQFQSSTCATQLAYTRGQQSTLVIIDPKLLNGQELFVLYSNGSSGGVAQFSVVID